MTGQQLRNSILQEAIQGRLVPNVLQPGEKTGAELLQDILAERQKKEIEEKGKKAKKLSLSVIEEEPWELPYGWCWCQISDICAFTAGQSPDGKDINEHEGIEFHQGKIYFGDTYLKEANIFTKSITKIAHKDSILLCMRAPVGVVNITPREICIGRGLSSLEPYGGISPIFLCHWLRSYKDYFEDRATGSTFKAITGDIVKNAPIPLPPLSIQKAIVEKIEALFPLVDEYDKAAGELKALNEALPDKLRKSVLQEAIHGNLVPNDIPEGEATAQELLQQILKERQYRENAAKGKKAKKLSLSEMEEEPWELPEGWCWARLGDVMTFINGRAYKKEELLSAGKYKVLRVGNFFTNDSWYYSDLELPDEKYCFKGDLLYAWSASFGPWIWEGDKTIFHYHIWNVKFDENSLFKKYLFWFFEADKHIIKESTTGSTMVHVSMENMMPRLIPIPPLSIQKAIVAKIEEVFAAIDKLKA